MTDERDEGVFVAAIPKNQREEIRVSVKTFKGYRFADARIYAAKEGGGWAPTAKGITARGDAIPALIKALAKAHELLGGQAPDRPTQRRNQKQGNPQGQNPTAHMPDDPLPW